MLSYLILTVSSFVVVWGYAPLREPDSLGPLNEAIFLQDVMERIGNKDGQFYDLGNRLDGLNPIIEGRQTKDMDPIDVGLDYDLHFPSIRDHEYLQPSSLWGNKYISGGAGEAAKLKGLKSQAEVKTDAILPAYCNPPNPCPVGQTAEDGCIENFENTAAFSRAYQASQECMCDTEHMFDCQPPQEGDDAELELARHEFLEVQQHFNGEHKSVMAKKFYNQKMAHEQQLRKLKQMARDGGINVNRGIKLEENPYLIGEKLPIAAKKGHV